MSKKYESLITVSGEGKIASSVVTGEKVVFYDMAVGDGAGSATTPDKEQTSLVNECYRARLNSLKLSDTDNIIIAEMIMPAEVGGFTIREAALFNDDGVCMAVANVPDTYKPVVSEGSGRSTIIRIWLTVSSTENIELIVDPSIVIATKDDVSKASSEVKDYTDEQLSEHASSRNHPDATLDDKGFTRLSNDIDSDDEDKAATPRAIKLAIESAIRAAWELDNPVGTTRFFNQNINPNERWEWSKWVYTGENKTIRIGKADGADVGATGGSDTVTLQRDNLPAVQIDVSGETSELPEATLTSKPAGRHKHGGVPSRDNPWQIGGDISQRFNPANLGETDEADDHQHEVVQPAHKHTTSGKTDNLGTGQSFSVVEAHTLLMCWSRVA